MYIYAEMCIYSCIECFSCAHSCVLCACVPWQPESNPGSSLQRVHRTLCVFMCASCMQHGSAAKPSYHKVAQAQNPDPHIFLAATQRCDNSSYDTFGPTGPADRGGEL